MILTLTNFLRFSHSIIFSWLYSLGGQRPPRCWGFEITLRHTTLGRTPLDEWSARRRDLWQPIRDRHPCPPVGFEPANPASERQQTHALNRSATDIGISLYGATILIFFYGSTAPFRVPRPPHFEASRSHTLDTPYSVGLLWTRDQLVAETSTWQHTTLTRTTLNTSVN
jgi:hypothetical protein